MSAITDEAVLAGLKQNLNAYLRGVIASAATLPEAEKLLVPHCGGLGTAREKVRLMRQHLEPTSH